jgi:hypothetical protein
VLLLQQGGDTRCGSCALYKPHHTVADVLERAQPPHAVAAGWKACLRWQAPQLEKIPLHARTNASAAFTRSRTVWVWLLRTSWDFKTTKQTVQDCLRTVENQQHNNADAAVDRQATAVQRGAPARMVLRPNAGDCAKAPIAGVDSALASGSAPAHSIPMHKGSLQHKVHGPVKAFPPATCRCVTHLVTPRC